jgi:hypothetical protein
MSTSGPNFSPGGLTEWRDGNQVVGVHRGPAHFGRQRADRAARHGGQLGATIVASGRSSTTSPP